MKTTSAKPFVKWAGGKQSLADRIVERFPKKFARYYEPFLGGGSVLFTFNPTDATVGDSNEWLITTYKCIRSDWARVASVLDSLPNTKTDFLRIRSSCSKEKDEWRRAANFIYLNKTCFRGLYRVNRNNEFNVPYGEYDRRYYDPLNLQAVSEALRSIEFRTGDFEITVDGVGSGDFVYFDPPYYKLGGYSDFNRYTANQFREAEHLRLASLCKELNEKKVKWLVSNSDTAFVRKIFQGFNIIEVSNRRDINLQSDKRDVVELLIANY